MPGFSLRNPHTIIVGALIVALLGLTAFARMPVDVFPNLKIPAVVVATFYPGMPPTEIERDITTRFERFFTLGSDIEHIESRSLPGVSIIKVFFHPSANVDTAAASLANLAMADLRHLPPGTLPPLVLKSDASSLPVTLVTVAGEGLLRGAAARPGAVQRPQPAGDGRRARRCRRRSAASTARSWSTPTARRSRRAA